MALYVDIVKKLGNFTLNVKISSEGKNTALYGLSGSGKSVTLKCIAGVMKPDSGRIVVNDKVVFDSEKGINLPPQKRNVGYLPQNYALFPNLRVKENIACGLRRHKRKERAILVEKYIKRFGLSDISELYPHEISGGQQQRVALARALATNPDILLLDEPFSALDSQLKLQLELDMLDTLKAYNGDVLFVSHNRDEVCRLCECVCIIDRGSTFDTRSISDVLNNPVNTIEATLSDVENIGIIRKNSDSFLTEFGFDLDNSPDIEFGHIAVKATDFKINDSSCDIMHKAFIDNIIRNGSEYYLVARCVKDSKPLLVSVISPDQFDVDHEVLVGLNYSDIIYLK